MDREDFDFADVQESAAASAPQLYDDAELGVECAWPATEREALLTLS